MSRKADSQARLYELRICAIENSVGTPCGRVFFVRLGELRQVDREELLSELRQHFVEEDGLADTRLY
ncbi:hypothetical protein CH380_10885 [Leptospira adleri]|uniref:Uncharacterized protein n=1 Tax=Leptospira adleri TaxID=2023186 RepID=A0A2M9YP35_9LEPT|nr:hypothetical protein CH380_10885 [Leptospira adleri]PJZ63889.1 hypothetical protein CH376_00225 [Leptospira adleri]